MVRQHKHGNELVGPASMRILIALARLSMTAPSVRIDEILKKGMRLQNAESLNSRIRSLQNEGAITAEIAEALSKRNQANDENRARKIWFCFHPPEMAGENGIGRFFRHWGGEALYNSHEDDPITSPILRTIGIPVLIEANVPIASLNPHSYLSTKIIRRYFVSRGWKTEEELDHEGYAVVPLPASAIRRIVKFPDPEFIKLTGCNTWSAGLG